jgi:hypothetical protein
MLAFDGLAKPLSFRTNCNEAALASSGVTGGSKLKSVLMFLHMGSRRDGANARGFGVQIEASAFRWRTYGTGCTRRRDGMAARGQNLAMASQR